MFTLEEIVQKLGVTPGQLRSLADKMEKNTVLTPISYEQKVYNEYYQRLMKMKKRKTNGI